MSYYGVDGDDEEDVGLVRGGDEEHGGAYDGRTPLDRTIDKIGMGGCTLSLTGRVHQLAIIHLRGPHMHRQLSVDSTVPMRVR